MSFRGFGLVLGLAAVAPAQAAGDCTCRAKDVVAKEGQTVCLVTPSGPRLAVCEKVLNNTSWRFLGDGCGLEVTELGAVKTELAMSPAAGRTQGAEVLVPAEVDALRRRPSAY